MAARWLTKEESREFNKQMEAARKASKGQVFDSRAANKKIAQSFAKPSGLTNSITDAISKFQNVAKQVIPKPDIPTYDTNALYNMYGGGSSSGGGGGMSNISNILAAYDKEADAARAVAESTYQTTRNDLLTSLKRFQEQNAKQVENQKRSYLTGQSNLESARAEADRQNRISAASRGLGGSGLQQLSQLKNLLNQSQDISELALENQNVMEGLRTALANQEEDTNTKLANALSTRDNALKTIEAQRAANKANIEYQAREAAASRAAASRANDFNARQMADAANTAYTDTLNTFKASLKKVSNAKSASTLSDYATEAGLDYTAESIKKMGINKAKKNIAKAYATIVDSNLSALNEDYGLPSQYTAQNRKTVNDLLKYYGNTNYY